MSSKNKNFSINVKDGRQLSWQFEHNHQDNDKRDKQDLQKEKKHIRFNDPNPKHLFIGNQRIDRFLQYTRNQDVFVLRDILEQLDWSPFEQAYRSGGRPPHHPRAVVGLILFGIMEARTSLRQLETIARSDVRVWWLTGGMMPDHSSLGKFLCRHEKILSKDFFEDLTSKILKQLHSDTSRLAGDGTVIEAVASRFHLLKQEAAEQAAAELKAAAEQAATKAKDKAQQAEKATMEAKKAAEQAEDALALATAEHATPETEQNAAEAQSEANLASTKAESATKAQNEAEQEHKKLGSRATQAEQVAQTVAERNAAGKANGRKNPDTAVNPHEPEAVLQKQKNKTNRPSYKPSIVANEDRLITGFAVDPTNEGRMVEPMVEQSERISGQQVDELLLDANYFNRILFWFAYFTGLSLLCPPGKTGPDGKPLTKETKRIHKSKFRYDEQKDEYICPSGQRLRLLGYNNGGSGQAPYASYRCNHCEGCALKPQCAPKSKGRTIKRYAHDALREAQLEVMNNPLAQERYRQRKAMVEPVFSELRYAQGLVRFRRRGLAKVRMEFSLHCCSHNLRRYVRILGGRGLLVDICAGEDNFLRVVVIFLMFDSDNVI